MRRLAWVLLLLLPTTGWAATTGYTGRLQAAILAACPSITSLTIVVNDDRGVGLAASDNRPASVDLAVVPTTQTTCARTAIAVFDWTQTTQAAWDLTHLRSDAAMRIQSDTDSDAKLKRAIAAVLLDEINILRAAYPIPVASITRSGTVATATTRWAHGLTGTPTVTIHGADVAAYNGAVVIAVTGASTFTYTVAGSPATPAVGSLLAFPVTAAPAARTLSQAITAIQNKLTSGAVDGP